MKQEEDGINYFWDSYSVIELENGNEKYLKYSFVFCLIAFVLFSSYLPKYSFNQYDATLQPVFEQIKSAIDYEPVYVNAFHLWFIVYRYDLNATTQNESKWTLDIEKGQLYLTNKTNITGV
jgi:hypothetical protein